MCASGAVVRDMRVSQLMSRGCVAVDRGIARRELVAYPVRHILQQLPVVGVRITPNSTSHQAAALDLPRTGGEDGEQRRLCFSEWRATTVEVERKYGVQ